MCVCEREIREKKERGDIYRIEKERRMYRGYHRARRLVQAHDTNSKCQREANRKHY